MSISRTGSRNDATCRMRSSGRFGSALAVGALLRERPGPPFFARAQAAIPEIDERREARLQRGEAEPVAGVLDVRAIELLDQRLDAARGSPTAASAAGRRRTCCIRPRAASARLRAAADRVRWSMGGHGAYRGMRNQTSGSHSSRAYGTGRSSISTSVASERADDLETARAAARRRSTRTARGSDARRRVPVSRNSADARASSSARAKSGMSRRGKHERDRERPRLRAEQRLVQIGIERRELLVGRLLRQLGVRPEALERPVLRADPQSWGDDIVLQNCRIAGLQERRISSAILLQFCNPAILQCLTSAIDSVDRAAAAAAGGPRARGAVRRRGDRRRAARGGGRGATRDRARRRGAGDGGAVVARIEAAAAAQLADAFRPSLAAGHQRDRRRHPHESRTRAAGGGGHRAGRRRRARLLVARIRPRARRAAAGATSTPKRCSAG